MRADHHGRGFDFDAASRGNQAEPTRTFPLKKQKKENIAAASCSGKHTALDEKCMQY